MNQPRSTLAVAQAVALALACTCHDVWADPVAQMRQCRLLTEIALRTACYDAIALPTVGGQASSAASSSPLAVTAASAGVQAAPATASSVAAAAAGFGLPIPLPAPAQADALESSIAGLFEGWQPKSRIRLANGQIWQVTDGSEGVYTRRDPKVRISRGTLGSFFMQIEGVSQTPRVRRIE